MGCAVGLGVRGRPSVPDVNAPNLSLAKAVVGECELCNKRKRNVNFTTHTTIWNCLLIELILMREDNL